jgi:hypothetical protein
MENPPTPIPIAAAVIPGSLFICGVSGADSISGAGVGGGGPGPGDLLLSSLGVLVRNKPVPKSLTRLIGELQGHGWITASRTMIGHNKNKDLILYQLTIKWSNHYPNTNTSYLLHYIRISHNMSHEHNVGKRR